MNVILTSYFTMDKEPQRGVISYTPNTHSLVRHFAGASERYGDQLEVVIFHNQLSGVFQTHHRRYANLSFERIPVDKYGSPPLDCNHFRYAVYRDWLLENEWAEQIFCTDLFDVFIKSNPFPLLDHDQLCLARETQWLQDLPWVRDQVLFLGEDPDTVGLALGGPIYNPGIFGGRRRPVLKFLDEIAQHVDATAAKTAAETSGGSPPYFEVGLFNVIASRRDPWERVTPPGLVNKFRSRDWRAPTAFIHK